MQENWKKYLQETFTMAQKVPLGVDLIERFRVCSQT